jgi:hypothetical protein
MTLCLILVHLALGVAAAEVPAALLFGKGTMTPSGALLRANEPSLLLLPPSASAPRGRAAERGERDLRSAVLEGALPAGGATGACRQLCAAVAHLHAHDWCHRDLKPGNVLLVGGVVKLCDFGLARILPPPPACAATGRGAT